MSSVCARDLSLPPSFHPLVREWFTETYGKPTAVQAASWPVIAEGSHALLLAPTGSGKTLAAFLAALSRFCTPPPGGFGKSEYAAGELSVLYVSPLKALNEDIRRNLLEPLSGIRARFEKSGVPFPAIRAETRSGDTPQPERRRFLVSPPSILALTPESLAIILLNPKGRKVLASVKYVILDEIHSALGTKRGSFLSCQIERLALVAGEFQRVSLSATVKTPQAAAEFTGGTKRAVRIIAPQEEKRIELAVEFSGGTGREKADSNGEGESGPYRFLIDLILKKTEKKENAGNGTQSPLLVFTDSRRHAERIAFLVNRKAGRLAAYAHHGSLAKEIRRAVEKRLAEGSLSCVIATSSLELGIDIGGIDEVILAGSPSSVSQTLQRIGRSGHGAGRISSGTLVPFHRMDLLLAAGLAEAAAERDIEEIRPVENPLDILAQIILSLCTEKDYNVDGLYELIRSFYIFRNLKRPSYDAVIAMLTETYRRVRGIRPRLYFDKTDGTLSAAPGALELLYTQGGVIANRGYYSLRIAGSGEGGGTKIGELDEEFVWERRTGDCFEFGTRGWRITAIGPEAVQAVPLEKPADYIPFWKAEKAFESPVLARHVLAVLERYSAARESRRPFWQDGIIPGFSKDAAENLEKFLDAQYTALGSLPGKNRINVEIIRETGAKRGGRGLCQVVLHCFRGGAVNYPFSLALAQSLEERLGVRVDVFSGDNGILLVMPGAEESGAEVLLRDALGDLDKDGGGGISRGERLFRKRLESSSIFGAAFREAAERSLVISRPLFGKRTPLWITRQKSKRLFDAAGGEEGFPVTAEAWRSCLKDMFDMEGFRELQEDIQGGVELRFSITSRPSPFARDFVREETSAFMYEYDEREDLRRAPFGGTGTSLSDRAIADALGEASLRPPLGAQTAREFAGRLRREIPGWTAEDKQGLAEWVKERIAIPFDEWDTLAAALPAVLKKELDEDPSLGGRIAVLETDMPPGREGVSVVIHREWEEAWRDKPARLGLLGPWLRYEGPVSVSRAAQVFAAEEAEAEDAARALAESGEAACDVSVTGIAGKLLCDTGNLDLLLRLARKKARPLVRERPAALLAPFLAMRQGILNKNSPGVLPWETISCLSAQADLWETEFFPARRKDYAPGILDSAIQEGSLLWYGDGKGRAGFSRPDDLDLAAPWAARNEANGAGKRGRGGPQAAEALDARFFDRPRDFWEIREALKTENRLTAEIIWNEAWKGRLSACSWEPVRRGLSEGFIPKEDSEEKDLSVLPQGYPYGAVRRRIPRAIRDKWRGGPPVYGLWYSLVPDYAADPFEEEELNRDRVRLLLKRWGIISRPLLEKEAPPLSWQALLPAIRRMELAGELAAGRFFNGINSLQFARPSIEHELEEAEASPQTYWMNAADPASVAGLSVEGLDPRLPARSPFNRLCFRGKDLIAVSLKSGKELRIFTDPKDGEGAQDAAAFAASPRFRAVQPEKKIVIERINEKAAAESEYSNIFRERGFTADRGKLVLW